MNKIRVLLRNKKKCSIYVRLMVTLVEVFRFVIYGKISAFTYMKIFWFYSCVIGLKENLRWNFECHTRFGNKMMTTQNLLVCSLFQQN